MIKKKYPANRPELKKIVKLYVGLFNTTIYRLRFLGSVFLSLKGRPKRKIRPTCLPVSPPHFLFFSLLISFNGSG